MQNKYLIAVDEFCASHNIEISFISSLQQTGMIQVKTVNNTGFIDQDQLNQLEKIVRLHYELEINFEGIEAINNLLQRINSMQDEIKVLRNKLRVYDQEI
jgi:hypothetical protein